MFGTVRLQATDELIAGSGSEQSNRARLREQLYRKDDAMREVVDGVIEIPIGYVNAFAVVVDDGVVLVDTGIPGRADKIESAVEEAQRRIGEVHTILLTHWHPDHVGSVAELRRRSGARIVAHAIDAPVISGAEPQPRRGFLRVLAAVRPAPEPVPVDETLTADGPISVPGFSAFHTPGHTPGHASFLLERGGGVLFAGDAASGGRNGRIRRSPRIITDNRAVESASISRLSDLRFEAAAFGHGRAISDAARSGSGSSSPAGNADCSIAGLRHDGPENRAWHDAFVVALQVRGVSEPTRRALSAEARARGESLQEYLLDLLDREARDIDNRRLLAELAAGPSVDKAQPLDFVELIRSERERRESQLARGRSSVE